MTVVPEQPTPLSTIPNSVSFGHAGMVAIAGGMYYATTQGTQSSNVIPDEVFEAHRIMQARNVPHLNYRNFTQSTAQQNPNWAEFSMFKEELDGVMRNKLDVDFGNTRLYEKPYHASFDTALFRNDWCMPDLVKFSGDD